MNFKNVMRIISALSVFLLLLPAHANGSVTEQKEGYSFKQLLTDAGLSLNKLPEFQYQAPMENAILSYEYALKHQSKTLAVRYAIRPIKMIEIDYEDPHNAAPEPNHLFPMLFQSLVSDFSNGSESPHTEYSASDARTKFKADWAAVALMDANKEFTTEYKQMLLLAIHKNYASDAYVMILFDDYEKVKQEINKVLTSLQYK